MKIKSVKLSIFIIIIASTSLIGQERGWKWAKSFAGPDYNYNNDVVVDNQNNIYITGNFSDSIIIGDTVLQNYYWTVWDAFILKLSMDGELIWVRQFEGKHINNHISDCDLAIDENNNIYVVGSFTHKMELCDTILESLGNWDIFVVKFDESGNLLKLNTIKGPVPDNSYGGTIWNDGLYIGTEHNGMVSTNSYTIFGTADTLFYQGLFYTITKFDEDLNIQWSNSGSTLSPYFGAKKISTDSEGFLYSAAVFRDSVIYNDTVIYAEHYYSNVIRKLDKDGNIIWMKQMPNMDFRDYCFDDSGNMYCSFNVTSFDSLVIIGNDTVTPINSIMDLFLAKFDQNLDNIWYKVIPDDHTSDSELKVIEGNRIILGGVYSYHLNIGDTLLNSNNMQSFVAEYDSDGNFLSVISTTGGNPGTWVGFSMRGMEFDNCGDLIITGSFEGTGIYGHDTIVSIFSGDAFIAKYANEYFTISLGGDTIACGSITISPGFEFSSYLWSNGSTLPYIVIDSSGLYSVRVMDQNYCKATDTVFVTIKPLPEISLGEDTLIKFSDTLRLEILSGYDSYLWQDGSTDYFFNVIGDQFNEGLHLFWVSAELDGCIATDSIWVNIIDDSGLIEETNSLLRLYPNPAHEYIAIHLFYDAKASLTIELIELYGIQQLSTIYSNSQSITVFRFPILNIKDGLYLIKIKSGEKTFWDKIIIKH
jgi:hypothetical protein